jgi:translation initiation factor 1
MGRKKKKISTDANAESFGGGNPFASLDASGLPPGGSATPPRPAESIRAPAKKKPGMRVEIRREKSGRGGKTVTTLTGLTTLDRRSFDQLLKQLKTQVGTGGAEIPGGMQLQGDCRDKAEAILSEKGFRPVRAGG